MLSIEFYMRKYAPHIRFILCSGSLGLWRGWRKCGCLASIIPYFYEEMLKHYASTVAPMDVHDLLPVRASGAPLTDRNDLNK